MPYGSNPGPAMDDGTANSMGAAPAAPETMDEGMHQEGMEHGEQGQLHIGAADLPPGMELNEGDIVEFKVVGPKDADGDWPVEYNYGDNGDGGEGKPGEGTSWEEDFRKSMSPREGGGESQQEPM